MCQSLNIVYLSYFAMKLFISELNKGCKIQSFLYKLAALFMCQVFNASNCKRNTDRYNDNHAFISLNFVNRFSYKEIARLQGHSYQNEVWASTSIMYVSGAKCFTTIEVHDNPWSPSPVRKKHIIL